MGRKYSQLLFVLYSAALVLCGVLRVILKLWYMDHETGFYTIGGPMVFLFNFFLGVVLVGLFAVNRLKRGDDDYPIHTSSKVVGLLSLLVGLAMINFSVFQAFQRGEDGSTAKGLALVAPISILVLGFLGGLALVLTSFTGLTQGMDDPPALLLLVTAIWQVVVLLVRFNSYRAPLPESDSLLAILFMISSTLFLMGHARNFNGLGRKDGRNYVISTGLASSLCGFLLTIPNFLYMLLYRQGDIPTQTVSIPECLYVLAMSIYSLAFVAQFIRSLKSV